MWDRARSIFLPMKGTRHHRIRPPGKRGTGWNLGPRKPRCRNTRARPGHRFYNPELGRWISRDPIGERGGPNLRAFSRNGGTNWYDPRGCKPERPVTCMDLFKRIVGQFDAYAWVPPTANSAKLVTPDLAGPIDKDQPPKPGSEKAVLILKMTVRCRSFSTGSRSRRIEGARAWRNTTRRSPWIDCRGDCP